MTQQTFVIVGAGLAGAKAADTLRTEGFDGRVVLIGAEQEPPYDRPPLSKGYLLGNQRRADAYLHPAEWYPDNGIDLRLGVWAEAVDSAGHEVVLSTGESLDYDKLLLATGSVVRRLDVPGARLDGVLSLRTMADAVRIKAALGAGRRIVVVGAGWIGLEVAAAARQCGAEVTVLAADALPLRRMLGDELATVFRDLHVEHGVQFRFGAKLAALTGDGSVRAAVLADGTELPADAVVVGVGVRPAVELAEAAGLAVDNGVLVDASLRSSDPDIYAAGDVANIDHPVLGRIRVEHWANALNSAPVAAKAMLGQQVSYTDLPYFFTDQYDLGMEYIGYHQPGGYDQVVYRGDLDDREFCAFWLADGVLQASMNVNVWDVVSAVTTVIGRPVDPTKLADPTVPLTEVGGHRGSRATRSW